MQAEDTVHKSGALGYMIFAVRKDTAAALAGTDGDYIPLITDATGQMWVNVGTLADGADATQGAIADPVVAAGATGTMSAKLRRLTTDVDALLTELQVKADPSEAQTVDGSAVTQPISAASLPLPTDAATQTTLALMKTALDSMLTDLQAKADLAETQPVSAASLPLPSDAATQTTLALMKTALDSVLTDLQAKADLAETQPVSIAAAQVAGTNSMGATKDDGPQVAGTPTYTTSADMSTAADIGPVPTASEKSVLLQATISADTAMLFTFQMETTPGAERISFYLPANGSVIFVPRYPIKVGTADKKWQGKASVSGNVAIHTTTVSEA